MIWLGVFVLEVFALFLLSRKLINKISRLFYILTRNKRLTVYLFAILFLPGTVVHELSHFLSATVLFVRTGKITLWPEIDEKGVKLGSVEIAKTDPIRRFIIGVAPFIFGTLILLAILVYISSGFGENSLVVALAVYLIFTIGNTMFSSKKDLEETWKLVILILIVFVILQLLGFQLQSLELGNLLSPQVIEYIKRANFFMLIPIFLDLLLVMGGAILLH